MKIDPARKEFDTRRMQTDESRCRGASEAIFPAAVVRGRLSDDEWGRRRRAAQRWRTAAALLLLAVPGSAASMAAEGRRPSVLLILVDDMGYSDPGCFGGEIQTPHLDALAAGGLRFTAFYNTSRCCPTRASLLTGVYAHQAGLGRMTFDRELPGYRGQLGRNVATIAELLGAAGYRTSMVGKWHLSLTEEYEGHMRQLNRQAPRAEFADLASYPVGRGFEEHYGIIWGVVNYYDPFSLVRNTAAIETVPEGYYVTDAFTDAALEFLDRQARGEAPFFLYLAHCAPHWPLHALPEDIAKYEGVYSDGWEGIRRERHRRQLELGLFAPGAAALSERFDSDVRWKEHELQEWDARRMECHAAMLDRVDQGVGRIVARLRELDRLDDTLILFLSDNGASREEPSVPGFDRNSQTRAGERVVYFGRDLPKERMPGPETTYAGIGPRWANAANTPFRLFKASPYEGGIRTPLIAHWPRGIAARGGITRQPGHVIDVMATCLDVAGVSYPQSHRGHALIPLEGVSLAPAFAGRELPERALYFEHFGGRAVRRGDWKLVKTPAGDWELYDFARDETETNDLAGQHPQRVRELAAEWDAWAWRAEVLPAPQD